MGTCPWFFRGLQGSQYVPLESSVSCALKYLFTDHRLLSEWLWDGKSFMLECVEPLLTGAGQEKGISEMSMGPARMCDYEPFPSCGPGKGDRNPVAVFIVSGFSTWPGQKKGTPASQGRSWEKVETPGGWATLCYLPCSRCFSSITS